MDTGGVSWRWSPRRGVQALREPGQDTLWPAICRRRNEALERGALEPISTELHTLTDGGIEFQIRQVSSLRRKAATRGPRRASMATNPFLPYDEDLFVASASDSHVALLNKFNVVDHHLLLVTRVFEEQSSPLTLADFQAWWTCLEPLGGLGFYNSGPLAGASQRHKHLQWIPTPLGPGPQRTPLEPLLSSPSQQGDLGPVPTLPFAHTLARWDVRRQESPQDGAARLFDLYRRMLPPEGQPHNLLVTRRWMLLVPRRRQRWETVEVNALGFAGSLLVRTGEELERVRQVGPLEVLLKVSGWP